MQRGYIHGGSIATLEDAVEYYDQGGNRNLALDPEIRPLRYSGAEKQKRWPRFCRPSCLQPE